MTGDGYDVWQMDTVMSPEASLKCILTLYLPSCELLIAHLMNRCTPGSVKLIFNAIQNALGDAYDFASVFNVILTDRGHEFGKPDELEQGTDDFRELPSTTAILRAVARRLALRMSTQCSA